MAIGSTSGGTKKRTSNTTPKQTYVRNLAGAPTKTARNIINYKGSQPTDLTSQDLGATESDAYTNALKALTAGAGGTGNTSLNRYTRMIQNMLTSGSYNKPYEGLQSQLETMYGTANKQIGSYMDTLKSALQAQTNPYAGFQAQQVQTTPELASLLESQGVSKSPLEQLAAVTQAQNTGQSTAYQNMVNSLGNIYGAQMAGGITDVDRQRTDLLNNLEQAKLGYGAQIAQKGVDQQTKLLELLLGAVEKGGALKKGRIM